MFPNAVAARHLSGAAFRNRLTRCGIVPLLTACVFLAGARMDAASPALTLQISSEIAPPGGWAQFKVFASAPTLIGSGNLSMDFDPRVFGPIGQLAVFSSTGDQIGYANVNGEHLDVHFSSGSAGIGQLPTLPVFTVSVPVLASAKPGAVVSIRADPLVAPPSSTWTDSESNPYSVIVLPGSLKVAGSLSVQTVAPGGGVLPSGTVLQLTGSGFDASTSVTIDGVSLSRVDFLNSNQMNLTLGGATEMTGKHIHVSNSSGGVGVDFYAALPSAPVDPGAGFTGAQNLHAILPFQTYSATQTSNFLITSIAGLDFAMLNQNTAPVTVNFQAFTKTGEVIYTQTASLPPGQLTLFAGGALLGALGLQGELWITLSAPVRFIEIIQRPCLSASCPAGNDTPLWPSTPSNGAPPLQITLPVSPSSASWSWEVGTPAPAPAKVTLTGSFDFTTSVSTTGGQWLSVAASKNGSSSTLTLTPDPPKLSAGAYSGTVTVTPIAPAALSGVPVVPTTINVGLTATSVPTISYTAQDCCNFVDFGIPSPAPSTLTIVSNGDPVPVNVSASTSTAANWLSVSPLTGTTPLQVTVTANSAGLTASQPYSGQITIQGPANTLSVPAGLTIFSLPPPPHGTTLMLNGPPPKFTLSAGSPPQMGAAGILSFQEFDAVITSVQTDVSWLTASIESPGPRPPPGITLYPNSVGLSPGTYSGTITITSSNYPTLKVPATLTVIALPTAQTVLTATPSRLSFTMPFGGTAPPQLLAIGFNGGPVVNFNLSSVPSWLGLGIAPGFTTAAPVYNVDISGSNLPPGTYTGGLVISWTTGSATVPVTLTVTATSASPPIVSSIVSAASGVPDAIAPGEIISILGAGVGASPMGLQFDASGKVVTNLGQTEVLMGGIPAPLIYASASQVNAVVPYELGTSGTASIQVVSNQAASATWEVPLVASAPTIFTGDSTGVGQAAVLNQDNTINGPANAALRGSVIQVFATGGGPARPPGVTGALAAPGETLAQAVTVTVGGIDAPVQSASAAPGEIEGLIQVNVIVPQNVVTGVAIPISLTVGDNKSRNGTTIAVK